MSDVHHYDTRNKSQFQGIRTRTKFLEQSIRYTIPVIINTTSPNILQKIYTHCFQGYSLYIKNVFINSYNIECNLSGCYVCRINH